MNSDAGGKSALSDQLGLEVAALDDGEAWSFCRTVMSDGRDIRAWHPDEGYERQSARMDAQAAKRGDELMAMVNKLVDARVAAERERWAVLCERMQGKRVQGGAQGAYWKRDAQPIDCAAAIREA